ncbi:MAG: hypothetical protein NC432_07960 [Roseburia sp.]|nr:hypothetical protein [Roseburia sp.]MCM1099125.1 hypothetical protein [Ruminococcus flavefaciens]
MKYLKYALLAVVIGLAAYLTYACVSFPQKGLDKGLVGQTEDAHYPDWGQDLAVLEADRSVLEQSHLLFSKVYLIKRSDNYQLRFRIGYPVPFFGGSLFEDTRWLKFTDSEGNDYSDCLTVSPSDVAGLNCLDATLVMDEDTFLALADGQLTVSAACTKDSQNPDAAYAECEVEIRIPEID